MTIAEGNLKSDIAARNVEFVVYALKEIIVSLEEFILLLFLNHAGIYH